MDKKLSNYWRKPEQHKPVDFVDDRYVIWGYRHDLSLVEKVYIYEGQIVPNRLIKNKSAYEITYLDPLYFINGFMVITEQDFVKTITLFGYHPNRDPITNLYCLPDYKKGVEYNKTYFDMLMVNIKTYYLDNCFFIPGSIHIKFKKINSLYVQVNRGEENEC